MSYSKKEKGTFAEDSFINSIQGKKFDELNSNLQEFIQFLFEGEFDKNREIYTAKCENYSKPDVYISIGNQIKFVSLKSGCAETLHTEKVGTVVETLKRNGISDESIETFLLFHYGDGSTDGSGDNRFDSSTTRLQFKERISALNKELNNNHLLVHEIVKRCVFQGVNELSSCADAIYHGNPDYGAYTSKNILLRYVSRRDYSRYDFPHIGPIFFHPHARYVGKKIANEQFRHEVTFYWPNLLRDLEFIKKYWNVKGLYSKNN